MADQPDLFARQPGPRIAREVDPDGPVVQGPPHETLELPHPRLAWSLARIELHRNDDGLWMWSASCAGGGYKVGPKWGQFAATRADALWYAAAEVIDHATRLRNEGSMITAAQRAAIVAWAEGLRDGCDAPLPPGDRGMTDKEDRP